MKGGRAAGEEMEKPEGKVMRPDVQVLTVEQKRDGVCQGVLREKQPKIDRVQIDISQRNKGKTFSLGYLAKNQ